jgi:hypothetical protein
VTQQQKNKRPKDNKPETTQPTARDWGLVSILPSDWRSLRCIYEGDGNLHKRRPHE